MVANKKPDFNIWRNQTDTLRINVALDENIS